MCFKDMLVYLRKRSGLSQETAAKRMGISRSTLANYEVGTREPNFETLEIIADFYNVNMDTLLCKEEIEPAADADKLDQDLVRMLVQLDKKDVPLVKAYIQGLIASRKA